MINKELREEIESVANQFETSVVMLDNPYFDNSILGYIEDGDTIRLVYDMDKMVDEFIEDSTDECTETDAIEFIEYNTLRAIPYMGDSAPLILHRFNV
jgi:hypothetical protein